MLIRQWAEKCFQITEKALFASKAFDQWVERTSGQVKVTSEGWADGQL